MNTRRLHDFARTWPLAITNIVEAAIEAGEVSLRDLRSIVIGPTRDWLTLGVWLNTSWEDYPYLREPEEAVGRVPISAWLDRVDALARGTLPDEVAEGHAPAAPFRFADDATQRGLRTLMRWFAESLGAVAEQVGTQHLARRGFKKLVGVFTGYGDAEAMLQAFCHPHGAPLWPVAEQRKEHGFGSAYAQGALIEAGLCMFYPEGEGESLGSKGRPSFREHRFADMVRVRIEADDRELFVRFRGEVFDVRFSPGHTHEEHGGPSAAEVGAALRQHFARRADLIATAPGAGPLPADAVAFEGVLHGFAEVHEQASAVEELIAAHGLDAVLPLLAAASIDAAVWVGLRRVLTDAFLAAGRAAEAMAQLEQLPAADVGAWRRAIVLLALGRYDDVLAIAADASGVAPRRVLALAHLGRTDEALALATAPAALDDDSMQTARALVLAGVGRDAEARDVLRAALLVGTPSDDLWRRVLVAPALGDVVREREAWERARALGAQQAKAAPVLELASGPVVGAGATPARILAAPLAVSAAATPGGEAKVAKVTAATRVGEELWLGDAAGTLWRCAPGGAPRAIAHPFMREIVGLIEVAAGVVVSDGSRLALLDRSGEVLARTHAVLRGNGALAARGDLVAQLNGEGIDLFRAGRPFERLGTIAGPSRHHFRGLAFAGPGTLLALEDDVVFVVDVARPAQPAIVGKFAAPDGKDLVGAGGLALLHAGDDTWLLRGDGAPTLRILARVPTQHGLSAVADGEHLLLLTSGWLSRVSVGDPVTVGRVEMLVGADGYPLDSPLFAATHAGGLAVVGPQGVVQLEPVDWEPAGASAPTLAHAPRIAAWCGETVRAWLAGAEAPIGAISLAWFEEHVTLAAGAPASVATGGDEIASARLTLTDEDDARTHGERARRDGPAGQLEQRLRHANQLVLGEARQRACAEILGGLRAELAACRATAAHVQLLTYDGAHDRYAVVATVATCGQAPPRRGVLVQRGQRSTRERLASPTWYREADQLTARARRDASFRHEVLEILAEGESPAAARIIRGLGEIDVDAVRAAWLRATARDAAYGIAGLGALAAHPEARDALERLCDVEDTAVAVEARRTLGRLAEPASLPRLRAYLELVGAGDVEIPGWLGDLPEATLAALPARAAGGLRRARAARASDVAPGARARRDRGPARRRPRRGWKRACARGRGRALRRRSCRMCHRAPSLRDPADGAAARAPRRRRCAVARGHPRRAASGRLAPLLPDRLAGPR